MTIQITEEYEKVFTHINEKRKNPLFVTGGAGSGKSTLIQKIKKKYINKNVVVVAPTGIAALNVGGTTIHSLFKIPPKFITSFDTKELKYNNMLSKIDIVIIDEISMVNANIIDVIDKVLKISCGNNKLFGGKLVMFFGDLYQLPPVVTNATRPLFEKTYDSPYFFSAKCLKNVDIDYVCLKTIFRQKDTDFVDLLNNIRSGDDIDVTIDYLNSVVPIKSKVPKKSIYLTTTNNKCEAVNNMFINKLDGDMHFYNASIKGKFPTTMYPVNTMVGIKKNAQVMCLKNQSDSNAVNGTIGIVKSMTATSVQITTLDGNVTYNINKSTWDNYRYKSSGSDVVSETIGTFTQMPIKLAWAITVHKSQGQTIDNVHIDMANGAFASGQLYVALSRCTSLSGLTFSRELVLSDVIIDQKITNFYKMMDNKT